MHPTASSFAARTAMYLRCYPFDTWQMRNHQDALRRHAELLALPAPDLYLDNGTRSCEPMPSLQELLGQAAVGAVRLVLVPGLFVFSLREEQALAVALRFRAVGCGVATLPSLRHDLRRSVC